jgi:hypothetical protein
MKIKLIDILIILFFLLAIYFIITKIFGNSASELTIMITLFLAFGSLLYKLNGEFWEFKIEFLNSFKQIKKTLI